MTTPLDNLRNKVIFQNSIDVWIALCEENGTNWNDIDSYKNFIAFLQENNMPLKAFTLCAHEAGAVEKEKTDFAESLRSIDDPKTKTYTIKLNDSTMDLLRTFNGK
jgi:hypothetical protein